MIRDVVWQVVDDVRGLVEENEGVDRISTLIILSHREVGGSWTRNILKKDRGVVVTAGREIGGNYSNGTE